MHIPLIRRVVATAEGSCRTTPSNHGRTRPTCDIQRR